jgi:hypothetical protein
LKSRATYWLWAIVFLAAAALLAWQVVTRTLAAHLAGGAPEAALRLHPSDPKALLALAERSLAQELASARRQSGQAQGRAARGSADRADQAGDRLRLLAELALKSVDRPAEEAGGAAPRPPAQPQPAVPSVNPQTLEQMRAWTALALANDPLNARALSILGQLADAAGDRNRTADFLRAAAQRSVRESVAVYWLMHRSSSPRPCSTTRHGGQTSWRTWHRRPPIRVPRSSC